MFKRIIILVALSSILLTLVVVKNQTASPVHKTNTEIEDPSWYKTVEYEITKIEGDQYYGINKEGKQIIFSAETISSGEKIQVNDKVLCYFEKDNLGKGIVKVEKK